MPSEYARLMAVKDAAVRANDANVRRLQDKTEECLRLRARICELEGQLAVERAYPGRQTMDDGKGGS